MENRIEKQQIAAQLLSGLMANPHIYASLSDEGAEGQQEQKLISVAIDLAEHLILQIDKQTNLNNK